MALRSGESPSTAAALPAHHVLSERYRIERLLGTGRFGLTYQAHDLGEDRKVVLKERYNDRMTRVGDAWEVTPFFQDEHTRDVARAQALAEAMMALNHPHLVALLDVVVANNTVYVVSEYLEGVLLHHFVRRRGRLQRPALLKLLEEIGGALDYLHQHQYVHRRVQLENIMHYDGRYVLLDYAEPAAFQRQSAWEAVVSPWGAPEQADPITREGPWTDIYAFGAVVYTCATGELPPSFRARQTGVGHLASLEDPDLQQMVSRALQLAPSARPQRINDWLHLPLVDVPVTTAEIDAVSPHELVLRGNAALDTGAWLQAERWYLQAAFRNHPQAQNNLGGLYEVGQGVPQNETEAARWYRKAAQQDLPEAQNNLGVMYKDGRGVKPDDTEAVRWFRAAAKQGLPAAQTNLGVMYEEGRGVAQSDHGALTWYRKAAEHNLADAQNNLGVMFKEGRGVAQDYKAAVQWYRLAAEQGLDKAQNNLGVMYLHGLGVAADDQQALHWFTLAAKQELAEAQNMLGWMHGVGRGVPLSEQEALVWFLRAAEQGLPEAQQNVGLFYLEGRGVPQDEAEGRRWLERARNAVRNL